MTDTLIPEPETAPSGGIPPFDEAVRYARAHYADAFRQGIDALRADGVNETGILVNDDDWRYRLIAYGDPERGIEALDIGDPGLAGMQAEAINEITAAAKRLSGNPILLWNRHPFPGDWAFQNELLQIGKEIMDVRSFGVVHECKMISTNGTLLTLRDNPQRGKSPVIDMSLAIATRRNRLTELAAGYITKVKAARTPATVGDLILEFDAEAEAAAHVVVD
jgi:hypothetical protein